VDRLGLERFALFGISQGAAVSIAYTIRHPERVSRLALFGGFAKGWRVRGHPKLTAQLDALLGMMRVGWGHEQPAFRQVFTSLFVPGATGEEAKWWNDLQRMSTSPENAVRLLEAFGTIDVSDLLPQITVPTLVLQSRGDLVIPFKLGLKLARGIPNAQFVALESGNHIVLSHEPAWERFAEELVGFLAQDGPG
jgi:pimeloyl-ACP methyl ester carboxylesterase